MEAFNSLAEAPTDGIFFIKNAYLADPDPSKIDVGVGAYRDDHGKPVVMSAVKKAERLLMEEPHNFEYLPIDGIPEFRKLASELLFGKDCPALVEQRIATVQSLSGTGALRLGGELIHQVLGPNTVVYVPTPTWENHNNVFEHSNLKVSAYRYYNPQTLWLDVDAMLEDINQAPNGSVFVLHACAHNPTGIDPSPEEMAKIVDAVKAKGHLAFLDSAYQGFASGDLERDALFIRLFAHAGVEFMVAQSFSKNMGLYNERTGTLNVVCATSSKAKVILSHLKAYCVRSNYSNPPSHGARIVAKILSTPALREEWEAELKEFAARIKAMRRLIYDRLVELKTPGSWERILKQIGMFSFTGLSPDQCEVLIKNHHIYLLKSGRVSMAGVTSGTANRIADAIDHVVRTVPARL
jgi:aspartate/tyrosine/aromatic aminotransferase